MCKFPITSKFVCVVFTAVIKTTKGVKKPGVNVYVSGTYKFLGLNS